MKVPILNLSSEQVDEIELPKVFNTIIRPDLIARAVISQQSFRFQPQGRDPMAGKRNTALSKGTGHAQARLPRLKQSGRADFAVQAVGGHLATPPQSIKTIIKKINKKEKLGAIRSGIAATAINEIVTARGHVIINSKPLPIVIEDSIEELKKTKDVEDLFKKLGIIADIERVNRKSVRAGRGNMRGRGKKIGKGPLIVINADRGIINAARNIPGVDIAIVKNLNAELLAPGAHPGRLVLWSKTAFNNLDEIWEDA